MFVIIEWVLFDIFLVKRGVLMLWVFKLLVKEENLYNFVFGFLLFIVMVFYGFFNVSIKYIDLVNKIRFLEFVICFIDNRFLLSFDI